MANAEYESILCVKPQVHVFRIPPRPSNRGYRAADWKLDQPDWTGRMRVVAKGKDLAIKLEDKTSGELFARCPVEQYPGIAVEAVTDSSRYFVLRIMNENGRSAFIGMGFEDRGDSFDLNVALQDHFKHLKVEKDEETSVAELQKGPKLDLGFKEGQTIRINIANQTTPKREKPKAAGGIGFLPPPPGGVKPPQPDGATVASQPPPPQQQPQQKTTNSNINSNIDLLLDFGSDASSSANVGQGLTSSGSNIGQGQTTQGSSLLDFDPGFDLSGGSDTLPPAQPMGGSSDPWGEFASANSSTADADWVQF